MNEVIVKVQNAFSTPFSFRNFVGKLQCKVLMGWKIYKGKSEKMKSIGEDFQ